MSEGGGSRIGVRPWGAQAKADHPSWRPWRKGQFFGILFSTTEDEVEALEEVTRH